MNTISFCILDDLEYYHGPVHVEFQHHTEIKDIITNLVTPFKETRDASSYFDKAFFEESDRNISEIVSGLKRNDYFVINRYNKYYVIAFAINYTRFEVFSKDCDKKLITWRPEDGNDPVKGIIDDEDYNENPVISFMRSLQRT